MQINRSSRVEYGQLSLGLTSPISGNTVCFTGHRFIPAAEIAPVELRLLTALRRLADAGFTEYAVGGAIGFDTMAARTVLMLKREFPDIGLHLVLPCRTQAQGWSEHAKAEYECILSSADEIIYVSDEYSAGCMLKRNRRLVDMSGICIFYRTRERGGTAYTVRYAQSKGLKLIDLGSDEAMINGLAAVFPNA